MRVKYEHIKTVRERQREQENLRRTGRHIIQLSVWIGSVSLSADSSNNHIETLQKPKHEFCCRLLPIGKIPVLILISRELQTLLQAAFPRKGGKLLAKGSAAHVKEEEEWDIPKLQCSRTHGWAAAEAMLAARKFSCVASAAVCSLQSVALLHPSSVSPPQTSRQ